MTILVRKTESDGVHLYRFKTNATNSLGVNMGSAGECNIAEFTSKANLTDITDPLNPISLGGNLEIRATLTDCGEPGENDMIGITIWDGNTLLFSSNWDGTETIEQSLNGGNLKVQAGFSLSDQTQTKEAEINRNSISPNYIEFKAYPNPFSDRLHFEFSSPVSINARIDIYDLTGRYVNTVFDGPIKGGVTYTSEFIPTTQISSVYIYKMTIGEDSVINGRVIYMQR